MKSNQNEHIDLSMLELFKIELENNTKVLENGLVKVEEEQSSQAIEPLMRAAHSIKGASKIVGLDIAVSLAHSMEDVLSSAQKGNHHLISSEIDLLLKANDFLLNLSKIELNKIPFHLSQESENVKLIVNQLRDILTAKKSKKIEIKNSEPILEKKQVQLNIDASMFDLFKIELENHTKVLENGLVKVEDDPTTQMIEPLMRSAHSIKGASRIIGLDVPVKLAHSMEDVLSSAQKGKLNLLSEHIDVLLKGNDFFKRLKDISIENISSFINDELKLIDELTSSLHDILHGRKIEKIEVESKTTKVEHHKKETKHEKKDDAFIRILAKNLNRLMGLAGESLVQAKSIKSFSTSLLKIKKLNQDLRMRLEEIYNSPFDEPELERECLQLLDLSNNLLLSKIEEFEQFSRRLENLSDRLYTEVVSSRMRPFSDGLHGFPRMVRDLSKSLNKKINFQILGSSTLVDRDILEKLESPLTHLLRNAIDHGFETTDERITTSKNPEGVLILEAQHRAGMLYISIKDDGKGIDIEKLRNKVIEKKLVSKEMADKLSTNELLDFLFLPGFSTAQKVTEVSGRGVGLDIVQSMIQEVRGAIRVDTKLGKGTTFTLMLPITLSVLRALLLEICNELYAIPLTRIDRIIKIKQSDLQLMEDRQFCSVDGENIGIINANQLLQLSTSKKDDVEFPVLIISDRLNKYGIVVDKLKGEKDLVVSPLEPKLGKIPNISAGAILEDGSLVLILDVDDLVRTIDNILVHGKPLKVSKHDIKAISLRKRVLVVDDSLTVREVERKLLENKGYDVIVAVDGMDGWNAVQSGHFDLVISDIDMPRMNGIEFVSKIKSDEKFKEIPVMIVSYKDREEDKIKGLQAGANYYLTKSSFQDESLITAVKDLIGESV